MVIKSLLYIHVPSKANIPSFSRGKENSTAPCSFQFSISPFGLDVFHGSHEADLCLLHPALQPVRLTHMDSTSGFPCLLATSSVDGKHEQDFGGWGESEAKTFISLPASLLGGYGMIFPSMEGHCPSSVVSSI